MKIAVSTYRDIVATVFDFAGEVTVFVTEGNKIINKSVFSIQEPSIPLYAAKLGQLNIKYLLCGAISNPAAIMLHHSGIEVIPGITGKANTVIKYFLNGTLASSKNWLPGFSFNRKGRGSGRGRQMRRRFGRQ